MKRLVFLSLAAFALFSASASAETKESLEDRIKPVGEVCMAGDACASAPLQLASAGGAQSGESIYAARCVACHGAGIAGAPKFGDAAAWEPRIAKGLDVLVGSVKNGMGAMPPGMCAGCSDEELNAVVAYITGAE